MYLGETKWVSDRFTGREEAWERLEYGLDGAATQSHARWEVYMLPQNDYLIQRDYLDYHTAALAEDARQRRLLHNAGLTRRTWFSCQVCRSLYRLGRLLVTTGLRLEHRYAPARLSHA